MNLIKDNWTKEDIKDFIKYLESLQNKEKILWTKNIFQTNMNCLAIKTNIIRTISKEISQGNYLSFLDHMDFTYYEVALTSCFLISKIKDFDSMKYYLDKYISKVDNWALCDSLSLNIKGKEDLFLNLTHEYLKSDKPFIRREGLHILFKFIPYDKYIDDIFRVTDSLKLETDYYVNMMNAWLLCELFIKRRSETLKYLKNNNLNNFTINKMISKCCDSYRVSKSDKELLLQYKKK